MNWYISFATKHGNRPSCLSFVGWGEVGENFGVELVFVMFFPGTCFS